MKKYRHVHFVGIGGIGMSGIARVLADMGYRVSGSDLKASPITAKLAEKGIKVFLGHERGRLKDVDLVVISSAVPIGNPEIVEAKEQGIPVIQRAEMLGYLMSERYGIAIAGTHGKTTTTSMVATILEKNGLDPTVVIGGELNDIGSNAKLGKGPYLVAEADESDASFLNLFPRLAIVTNIDADVNLNNGPFALFNFDYEKTLRKAVDAFEEFLNNVPRDGSTVVCTDCPHVRAILPRIQANVMTYGFEGTPSITARDMTLTQSRSACIVVSNGTTLGSVTLKVPGRHNILNAMAATATALQLGLTFPQVAQALEGFNGVQRRFQILGVADDVMVVDDYAHNPTKVKVTLQAAREGWPGRRIVAVFQPHRYTRTKFLRDQFLHAFIDADLLIITEIYSAGEVPIVGVKGESLAHMVREVYPEKEIVYLQTKEEILQYLLAHARSGDMVLTMGAGDIWTVGEHCLTALKQRGLFGEQSTDCRAGRNQAAG